MKKDRTEGFSREVPALILLHRHGSAERCDGQPLLHRRAASDEDHDRACAGKLTVTAVCDGLWGRTLGFDDGDGAGEYEAKSRCGRRLDAPDRLSNAHRVKLVGDGEGWRDRHRLDQRSHNGTALL
jgi:hypothetical protein